MTDRILIDGRPAQGRPRGMGVYVQRLVPALAGLEGAPRLSVALDRMAGGDPWPGLPEVERVWGQVGNLLVWEQKVLPEMAAGYSLLHCTANASPWGRTAPVVVTIHDAIFLRPFSHMADRFSLRLAAAHAYYRYGVRVGARRARLVLTDSDFSRRELIDRLHLAPAKVRTVPLAEPYEAKPLPEDELEKTLADLAVERPFVLGLGAIDRRKNTANLVRAFARLPRSAVASLVLAGFERSERSAVPALIGELGLKSRVKIFGYLPADRLTALFQGAAAFAYPSLAEGFGLPILHAFALGVPVVTSRAGAVAEVAGPGARLADPHDPRSIGHELMAAVSDPAEAHRLAYAGYMQNKQFSWARTARLTLDAYLAAIRETGK